MWRKVKAVSPGTWGVVGIGTLVLGVVIGWVAFPVILKMGIANEINLGQGKDARRFWIKLPVLDFNVYIFNITNPAEVMRGAKPIVEEIGPYCYKELKEKLNMKEDLEDDTLSYSARSTWFESPECPASQLTGQELLVIPNVPLMSVLLVAERDISPPLMAFVNLALPSIFGTYSDVFLRVSAKKLLFEGVTVDCTTRFLLASLVCNRLRENARALKRLGEDKYSFSFFGAKNGTMEEPRYTVSRGTEDGLQVGRLVAVNDKPELTYWRGRCNKLLGTDATIFPPFRQPENGSVVAYSSEICRVMHGVFEGVYDYRGIKGYQYSINLGDTESNPQDRCFCPQDNRCFRSGVLDAYKCQGAPLVASLPHFHQASRHYRDGVVGLHPDKEKHGISLVIEPTSGVPLVARKRIQLNIDLKPIQFTPITFDLTHTMVPLFWVEEMIDLDGEPLDFLQASLIRPARAVDVFKWICVILGAALLGVSVILKVRKNRNNRVHVLSGETGKELGYDTNLKSGLKYLESEESVYKNPFFIGVY